MPFPSPPPARAGARAPVRYCPELGEAICARIATGESVLAIGDDPANALLDEHPQLGAAL